MGVFKRGSVLISGSLRRAGSCERGCVAQVQNYRTKLVTGVPNCSKLVGSATTEAPK